MRNFIRLSFVLSLIVLFAVKVVAQDDFPVPTGDEGSFGAYLALVWNWIVSNPIASITIALGVLEIIVRWTPTEKDNNILRWIQAILDNIVPNRAKRYKDGRKVIGTHTAYPTKSGAPIKILHKPRK